nr:tyrosine-type recombinase/integrase [Streptomyces sp. H28]
MPFRCPRSASHRCAGPGAAGGGSGEGGETWRESDYFFTTRTGRPVEPRNLYRSFTRVARSAGRRVIRLYDARHGAATLLTAAGVAPRVVMEILGHSQISITMDATRMSCRTRSARP